MYRKLNLVNLVRKKNGEWRPCGDYGKLNTQTAPLRYLIPNILNITFQVFSTSNLTKAYLQIPLHPDDIPQTAVVTPFGLSEFLRMPFGMRNASETFQRFIDNLLREFPSVFAYFDVILMFSDERFAHSFISILLSIYHHQKDSLIFLHGSIDSPDGSKLFHYLIKKFR